MIPLKQWYCDSCSEIIAEPRHGYLEWRIDPANEDARFGFRIVHHALHSPNRSAGGRCYYSKEDRGGDLHLEAYLGEVGLVRLTRWLDVGKEKQEIYQGPGVTDLREWTDLFRRLHLPYYEEARQYLAKAQNDYFGESNEITFYSPQTLREIIENYSESGKI